MFKFYCSIKIGSMELRNRIMLPPHGAAARGVFRLPHFTERASMYADAIHASGAWARIGKITGLFLCCQQYGRRWGSGV
jgi:hypothetical protein